MNDEKILLLGCGILKKEIIYLIDKKNWPVETTWLDSSLHVHFGKLSHGLRASLNKHKGRNTIVFYGCCHPQMDEILIEADQQNRTIGQNCIDILLGKQLFTEELSKGAFFLLEDWADRWDYIAGIAIGNNPQIVKEIYQQCHQYLLCLRTICSSDYSGKATEISKSTGLPLEWMDVGLEHLETVLESAIIKSGMKV